MFNVKNFELRASLHEKSQTKTAALDWDVHSLYAPLPLSSLILALESRKHLIQHVNLCLGYTEYEEVNSCFIYVSHSTRHI